MNSVTPTTEAWARCAEPNASQTKVPELLFRHFVLPIRVNNETLDRSRMEFYNELRDRVSKQKTAFSWHQ